MAYYRVQNVSFYDFLQSRNTNKIYKVRNTIQTQKRMKTVNKAIIASLLIIAIAVLIGYEFRDPLSEVDVPVSRSQQPAFQTQLDNGLTITVLENHAYPLVTIQFWVKVGSRYEEKGSEGVAHIFEHIWFKGTELQPAGSFHKRVENLGGELNAMTSHDWTMFYVTLPKDKFDDIFPYQVDLLKNQLLPQEEIERELKVILEEQRKSYNDPVMHLDEEFSKLFIEEHPYRNPIIGYKDTIENMSREQIKKVYETYYVPNNINIVVVGDVNTATVTDKIEAQLGGLRAKPLPKLDLEPQQPHEQPSYDSITRDLGKNYIAMGYITPEATHPDHYTLDVIAAIFAKMKSSRMQQQLKETNLITSGRGISVQLTDFGAFMVIMNTDPDKRNQAVTELIKELNKLKLQKVSEEELERAKQYIRSEFAKKNEEIFEQGMYLGQAWVYGNFGEAQNYLRNIDKVTREEIQEVADKYFNNYVMFEIKPEQ